VISDKIPEITEEFTMTVKRANGTEVSFENRENKTKLSYVMSDDRIARLAKEVLNGRRRANQT